MLVRLITVACATLLISGCHGRRDHLSTAAPPVITTNAAEDAANAAATAAAEAAVANGDAGSSTEPSTSTGEPQNPKKEIWINLGDGLSAPFGETLVDFKSNHPDANCFDEGTPHVVLCSLGSTIYTIVCPSTFLCSDSNYTFTNGILDGFRATYEVREWSSLLTTWTDNYGIGTTEQHDDDGSLAPISLSTRLIKWDTSNGELTFIKLFGVNIHNEPFVKYNIMFEPHQNSSFN
jgi:hypothetical protein